MKTLAPTLMACSATSSKACQILWNKSQCSLILRLTPSPRYQLIETHFDPPVHGHDNHNASNLPRIRDLLKLIALREVKSNSSLMATTVRDRDHRVRRESKESSSQHASTKQGRASDSCDGSAWSALRAGVEPQRVLG